MAVDVPLRKPCGLCRRLAGGSHCQFCEMVRDGAVAIVTAVYKIQIKLMFYGAGEFSIGVFPRLDCPSIVLSSPTS